MDSQFCASCEGTGRCAVCNGVGSFPSPDPKRPADRRACKACHALGSCWTCGGKAAEKERETAGADPGRKGGT
jgi:hypothetical protein